MSYSQVPIAKILHKRIVALTKGWSAQIKYEHYFDQQRTGLIMQICHKFHYLFLVKQIPYISANYSDWASGQAANVCIKLLCSESQF
jgi:hypothetical protein